MTKSPKNTRPAKKKSYEGTPSKLLGAILPRIKRREPEFDAISARLQQRKGNPCEIQED